MFKETRQGWLVVGALFVSLFFVWGAANAGPVFFVPLLKEFGWSRERLSTLFGASALATGASGPLVGWLLDRVDARKVIAAGALLTIAGLLALSRVHSYPAFLAIYVLLGAGGAASTMLPASVVIPNWFHQHRGIAMGAALCAAPFGGAAMTIVANYAISYAGWRAAYVTLAVPVAVLVLPVVLIVVRTRPPAAAHETTAGSAPPIEIPGFDVSRALRTRTMWMISAAMLLAGMTTGFSPHYIAYLINVGYTATLAAEITGLSFLVYTVGNLMGGPFADWLGARRAYALAFLINGFAQFCLLGASNGGVLTVSVLVGGIGGGASWVLAPLLMVDSFGLRKLGSLMGVTGIFFTVGAAIGPVITGHVFDASGSYRLAIWIFIAMLAMCAAAIYACRSMEDEEARLRPVAPRSAA
jgi:MFS family permease